MRNKCDKILWFFINEVRPLLLVGRSRKLGICVIVLGFYKTIEIL